MVSVSVWKRGHPASSPVRSVCFRNSIGMFLPCPACASNWFIRGHAMCYHVCVITHVKDPQLSVVKVGHGKPLAGFCLSLYDLHALNRDVNMIQTKQTKSIVNTGLFQLRQVSHQVTPHTAAPANLEASVSRTSAVSMLKDSGNLHYTVH